MGNPNDYLQLNRAFKLYDKNGKAGHLTGTYVDKDGKKLDWFEFGGWTYNRRGNYYTSSKRKMKGPKTFTAMNLAEHMAFRGHQPKGLLDAMRMSTTGELWRGMEKTSESLESLPTVYIK